MITSFQNQVAFLTGAASGIGLATAQAFAQAGAAVAVTDVNEDAAKAAADALNSAGHQALGLRCDVSDEAQVVAAIEETVAAFGRLDAAYNHPASMQAVIDDIPLGRMGTPEEIASAVVWLCSPGAGFMIGQIVAPDCGYCAR